MNQILSTDMPMNNRKKNENINKYKPNRTINSKSIIKVFAVCVLIVGIVMVGTGAYAIYKNQVEQTGEDLDPTISLENKTDTTLLLKITHSVNISRVRYRWNEGEEIVINGKDGKYLEQEISIPSGNNTLHIIVEDENGREIPYDKDYTTDSNINIEVVGNKIKITYQSDKTISYMTYRWDDEEETRVDINNNSIEQEIDVLKGLHTLTVIVVDEDNNTDTKEQKINGVSKPKVQISVDETREHFVIIASDENKIEKVEIILNQDEEQKYVLNFQDRDIKEMNYTLPMELQSGDNFIKVTIYNADGVTEEAGAKFVK